MYEFAIFLVKIRIYLFMVNSAEPTCLRDTYSYLITLVSLNNCKSCFKTSFIHEHNRRFCHNEFFILKGYYCCCFCVTGLQRLCYGTATFVLRDCNCLPSTLVFRAAVQTFVYLWSTVLWLRTFAIVVYEGGGKHRNNYFIYLFIYACFYILTGIYRPH